MADPMILLRHIAYILAVIALCWAMVALVSYVALWLAQRIING